MNVALSALPNFACLPEPGPHHASGIIMAPSLGYMDRAYLDARAEGIARAPIVEMVIPSTLDDTLAPKGAHVASLFCQHFAPEADWATRKQEAVDRIFDVVESARAGLHGQRDRAQRAARPPTWSGSSAWWAGTSSTASCRSTSCGRRGRCSGTPTTARR